MWVEWCMTHETGSQSTLEKETPVSTLSEKSGKHWSLTECLCNVAHTPPVPNVQDKKCQIKEQREKVLKISVHCYCNILALS